MKQVMEKLIAAESFREGDVERASDLVRDLVVSATSLAEELRQTGNAQTIELADELTEQLKDVSLSRLLGRAEKTSASSCDGSSNEEEDDDMQLFKGIHTVHMGEKIMRLLDVPVEVGNWYAFEIEPGEDEEDPDAVKKGRGAVGRYVCRKALVVGEFSV